MTSDLARPMAACAAAACASAAPTAAFAAAAAARSSSSCASELPGAGKPFLRGVELGLPLGYERLGGLLLGLTLGHQALRGLDADERPSQLRLGLSELRLQDGRVHFRQDLAGADEVALVDQDLPDPACGPGRDIDLDRLDPAVSGGESVGQVLRLKMPPSPNAQSNNNRSGDASNTCFNELFHVLDCSPPVGSLIFDH